ncbi:MAG: hypothetical protein FWF46_01885, partial [Oscillospiraceae bacterium]|nr:hypothetical protein [Oscillospiraceae bacterium]
VSSSDKAKLQQAINMLQAIKNKCTSPSTIQSQSNPVSQVQDAIARLNAIDNEIDSQWYNQLNYGVYSFTSGFASSLATNLAGQPTLGNDYGNKNTYYAGALAGDITSTVVGGLQIAGGIGLIISGGAMIAGGGIVTGTGEGAIIGVPAIAGGVTLAGTGVAAGAYGVGTIGNSASNFANDLSELFSGNGSSSEINKTNDIINETLNSKGNITSKYTLTEDEALDLGNELMGTGYKEVGKPGSGVFEKQIGDQTYRFRIDSGSLEGNHAPSISHVHVEILDKSRNVIVNNHIILSGE